ncbi:DUF5983 family protein [Yersinia pseudotuberculosis]|uniref:DUF5983 family protein n=1 Tax=Yersinia pseudotuberculosis TaxID=633 RepID=UPI0005DD68B4|nr:DUF5983 family protein [Yersinia pseudotuberculosis]AXY35661.1 hypothetical protein CEQ20_21340 [Yersinia pseudotuberculosis]AYX11324.1 hypothetical protein EGX52_11390 [Yersinia pseudotuberculosis]PEI15228.1 hypothetical protein CRM78_19730 [Yersinia pseudotuberculosis]CNH31058.1 Uncharacterised protein [Yersinia pseudotuberculosis]CNI39523.1 Uncharacterised protein [Yersinia pseudotuberculosis]
MKISMNVEADGINVLALNMGEIAVDVDGIEIDELIDVINNNGYTLRIASTPGEIIVDDPLPAAARTNGIQCSTAHITDADNALLHTLSQQYQDYGDTEWVHYTGSGYLIRLDARAFPVLRLKRRGLSKACRKLLVTLIRRYAISTIHFDSFGDILPGFTIFDW